MLIDKKDLPTVDIDFMNKIHEEDLEIINEMFRLILMYEKVSTEINRQNIDVQYQKWFHHTVEHFQKEEIQMKELNFPNYEFHKSEHNKALAQMDTIFREWNESQNIQVLKIYFREILPNWLIEHIKSMDTVTATFFKSATNPCSTGVC
jgi:hemerythrin